MLQNSSLKLRNLLEIHRNVLFAFRSSSSQIDIEQLESDQGKIEVIDESSRREELELKRNKSRLKEHDYRKLHEQDPYPEPTFWYHGTLKHVRRTYGRYGSASGMDPALCWPVKEELEEAKEYESVKYPFTVKQLIEQAKKNREEKEKSVLKRQEEICQKMLKLEQWKKELHAKIEKRSAEATAARERRERLIEEVRRHFGYNVDPKDARFQELLEKREKEEKKAMKQARKKAHDEKIVKRILDKHGKAQLPAENISEDPKNENIEKE
ncbi:growth arrest and DNA damage-inducible proteins-interacting protein 1 [Anthonomus grandis grandis]|uniref:growth arrest and DNA damage-inducible proteins-interacting protein 1 n=1 Tax=Anthonomus grandis grandis TaxID=2921223 RepID=UPI002165833C|nr:growth arrest and DNA damage-inducible proteins-interacting protein 1 [Anthonomus grandis grandis]